MFAVCAEKPDLAMKQSIELFPYNRHLTIRACLILDTLPSGAIICACMAHPHKCCVACIVGSVLSVTCSNLRASAWPRINSAGLQHLFLMIAFIDTFGHRSAAHHADRESDASTFRIFPRKQIILTCC